MLSSSLSRGKTIFKDEAVIFKTIDNIEGALNIQSYIGVGIMYNIGDYVLNHKTGYFGKVIGYGHQILDNVYTTTLKVLVQHTEKTNHRGFVTKDLYSQ